jgi:hypothetical protein
MDNPVKTQVLKNLSAYMPTRNNNASSSPSRPVTKLHEAVPVTTAEETAVITLHSHRIIIERQDNLYKTLAVLEGVLLVASSLFMISLSAASIIFALSMVSGVV